MATEQTVSATGSSSARGSSPSPSGSGERLRRLRIAREGVWFVVVPLALAAVIALVVFLFGLSPIWWLAALPFAAFGLFSAYFFRDPDRAIPADPCLVVSPADGKVIDVVQTDDSLHVAIFLNVFNVHVNRAPVAGRVVKTEHTSGRFLAAFDPRVAELNERNELRLETDRGTVRVMQIAGLIARRIVCRAGTGDALSRGERFGLIRFGSRTDVILPQGAEPLVEVGDKVRGGSSAIARWIEG